MMKSPKPTEEYIEIHTSHVMRNTSKSLTTKNHWESLEGENSAFGRILDLKHRKAPRNFGRLLLSQNMVIREKRKEALAMLGDLGDRASDLFDVVFYLWNLRATKENEFITLTANDVAHLLQIPRSSNGTISKSQKDKIDRCMNLLGSLKLDVRVKIYTEAEDNSGKRKEYYYENSGPMLLISSVSTFRESEIDIDGTKTEKRVLYTWKVKPGEVIAPFLGGLNKQFTYLHRKVLEFNPKTQWLHKRLAKSGYWYSRVNYRKNEGIARVSVRSLLDDCLVDYEAYLKRRNANRLIELFEEARSCLLKEELFINFDYTSPSIIEQLAERPSGYFEKWLDTVMIVKATPMPVPDEALPAEESAYPLSHGAIEVPMVALPRPAQSMSTPEDCSQLLQQIKIELGLSSNTELATRLGIGKSLLSMVLSAKRKPSKSLIKRIQCLYLEVVPQTTVP